MGDDGPSGGAPTGGNDSARRCRPRRRAIGRGGTSGGTGGEGNGGSGGEGGEGVGGGETGGTGGGDGGTTGGGGTGGGDGGSGGGSGGTPIVYIGLVWTISAIRLLDTAICRFTAIGLATSSRAVFGPLRT